MTVYIPGGLIAIFISLYIFYSNRQRRNKIKHKRNNAIRKIKPLDDQ